MAEPDRVRLWADALIALYLDPSWTFGFDHARTRAGLCNHTAKRITVSRHLIARADDDEIHQTLLHEVAHALAGPSAGHGAQWKAISRDIGYVGGRLHDDIIGADLAPWVGTCPRGHVLFRYRRPAHPVSCGSCSRRFDPAFQVEWRRRDQPA